MQGSHLGAFRHALSLSSNLLARTMRTASADITQRRVMSNGTSIFPEARNSSTLETVLIHQGNKLGTGYRILER